MLYPDVIKLFLLPVLLADIAWQNNSQRKFADNNEGARSQWVYFNQQGKLTYKSTEKGDRIIDFSYAGYGGGGKAIPSPNVKITIQAVDGDNTTNIQAAIDAVSKLKMVNGFRGAVLLKPGNYNCEGALNIQTSGVVLRGSGMGTDGTIINLTGKPHTCITVKGDVSVKNTGNATMIADAYVPAGAVSFKVTDASELATGDTIRITKPVTDAWIQFMGMDKLVRDGKNQTWMSGDITTERTIRKIVGHRITVDVPLTDSYDATYTSPGITVQKISVTGQLSNIGIENLRIVSPEQSVTISEGHHRAFTMSGITDGWARDLEIFNTVNSISVTGKRITVENINIGHNVPTIGAAKPADLNGSGPQILFNRCTITGSNVFFFATGAKVTGPIVLLNCTFNGNGWIQPHQRWATGVLVDNCKVPDGGIDFMNRGTAGSGHGWAIGWSVAWNCTARSFLNQQPPGAMNWVIGSTGEQRKRAISSSTPPFLPEGTYDAHTTPVQPQSLYLSQLAERIGKK
jgi:hypothetical protein